MSWIRFFYSCLCFVYLVKSSNPRFQIWVRYYELHLRISARDTSLEKSQVGVGRSISNILFHVTYLACLKAETHDATNHCDTSPRHVAATNRLVWQVKIIVAAICRTRIRAKYRSDKISTSSLVAACVRFCDKSPRQNLNQLMRERPLFSRHVKFELVYIFLLPNSLACIEQVSCRSDLPHQQCRRGDLSLRCVAASCCIVCLGLNCSQWHKPEYLKYKLALSVDSLNSKAARSLSIHNDVIKL